MPTALKGRDEVNIMWKTLWDNFDAETQKVIYEDENQIHVHHHYKLKSTDVFYSVTQTVNKNTEESLTTTKSMKT